MRTHKNEEQRQCGADAVLRTNRKNRKSSVSNAAAPKLEVSSSLQSKSG